MYKSTNYYTQPLSSLYPYLPSFFKKKSRTQYFLHNASAVKTTVCVRAVAPTLNSKFVVKVRTVNAIGKDMINPIPTSTMLSFATLLLIKIALVVVCLFLPHCLFAPHYPNYPNLRLFALQTIQFLVSLHITQQFYLLHNRVFLSAYL